MDIKELKEYTKNIECYDDYQINKIEVMTQKELEYVQHEIEHGTGSLSDWDMVRTIITFKKQIKDLEEYAYNLKEIRDVWKSKYEIIRNKK